jgi:hypothetical protein
MDAGVPVAGADPVGLTGAAGRVVTRGTVGAIGTTGTYAALTVVHLPGTVGPAS